MNAEAHAHTTVTRRGKTLPLTVFALMTSFTASVCCLGPLLLLAGGLSGAWMSRVMAVESFQPLLIAASLGSMALAAWQIFRTQVTQEAGCNLQGKQSCEPSGISHWLPFLMTAAIVLLLVSSEFWVVYFFA